MERRRVFWTETDWLKVTGTPDYGNLLWKIVILRTNHVSSGLDCQDWSASRSTDSCSLPLNLRGLPESRHARTGSWRFGAWTPRWENSSRFTAFPFWVCVMGIYTGVCARVCANLLVISWTKSQEGHLKTRVRGQTVKVRMVDVSTGIWGFLSPLTLFYLSSPLGQEVSGQTTHRFVELMWIEFKYEVK